MPLPHRLTFLLVPEPSSTQVSVCRYNNNANEVYTICPTDPFTCLAVDIVSYNLENGLDNLLFYDGPSINDPLITVLTGVGGNLQLNSSNCVTVQFVSDFIITSDGWEISWSCSPDACPPDGSAVDPPDQTACSGNFFDSGGPASNYQNNESWDYTICPDDPHGCLVLTIDNYDINPLDLLTIFEGPIVGGPIVEQLSGAGSNVEIQTDQGCFTVAFTSSVFSSAPGWSGSWTCTPNECTAPVVMDVTPNVPDTELVETILSTLDVLTMGVQLDCANGAYGVFSVSGGSSEIGMTSGIVLTSGSATEAAGPNNAGAESTILGTPGDPTLDVLANTNTNDACELTFMVFAPTSQLSFDYVFGSEEYPEYTCSNFNDPFAFFISGPGITGEQNIALVPGTTTPVTINNVNGGVVGTFGTAANCTPPSGSLANAQYYVNNAGGITTEYDGFTTVLTAEATVIPCNWYTLRLVVADAGDSSFDSGVFIGANSLEVGIAQISPSYEFSPDLDAAIEGCAQGFINILLEEPVADTTVITLTGGGTAISGVDYTALPDSVIFLPGETVVTLPVNPLSDNEEEGIEDAIIYLTFETNCGSFEFDSAKIIIQDNLIVDVVEDSLSICLGDTTLLKASGATDYVWMPADSLSDPNINDPFAWPTQSTLYTVIGSVSGGACADTTTVWVEVVSPMIEIMGPDTVSVCESRDSVLLSATGTGGGVISWDPPDGLADPGSLSTMALPDSTTTYVLSLGIDGCTAYDTITVEVIPFPFLDVIADTTACANDTTILAANVEGFNYQWVPDYNLDDANSANPAASPDTTTTYTVYLTNEFCMDSAQVTVNVIPLPPLDAGPDQTICEGKSAQLLAITETGGVFVWEPAATLNNQFFPNPVATPLETNTYYVTFTDQGCSTVDSVVVEVGPPVQGIDVVMDTTICFGESVVIAANTDNPGATYSWTPVDGLDDPNSSNPTATPLVTTVYTLEATLGPCTVTAQSVVNVIPELSVEAGPGASICEGDSYQLLGEVNPNGGGISWSPAAGLSQTDIVDPIATPTETTVYTLTYTVLDCIVEDTVLVEVSENLNLDLIPNDTICINESITLANNPFVDGATYSWTPTDGLNDPNTANPDAEPQVTTTYQLIAENGACRDTASVTIVVIPDLNPNAGEDVNICEGESAQLSVSVDVSDGNASWSPVDGLDDPTALDPVASPSQTTTYVLTYSIEECVETDTITVAVSEDIVLDLVADDTLCLGESIVLANDPMVQGATYSWTPVDGLDDPNSPTPNATPTQTTTYEVLAVNGACEQMASVTIVVVPDILPEAGDNINICVGDQTQLDASVNLTGGIISWSPADGLSQTDVLDPLANPTTTTTYYFTYTIEECSQTDSVIVEVSEDVVLNLTPDTDICLGDEIALANNPVIAGATYTWTPATGLDDPNSANPTASPEQTTTYELVAENGACSDSSTVTITVIRDLGIDAGDDVTICEGDIASLNAVGVNGSDYFWTPTDGLSDPEVANPDANPTTTTTYTVQYFEGPCFVEDSVTVNVAGNFDLEVSNDTTIFQLDVVELTAVPVPVNDNPIGNIDFSWESTTGLSEPTNPTTMASPLETITYTVTATSEFGCTATASVNVVVLEPTFGIPNAFSPNGDGLNDNFRIEVEGNITVLEFKVFDRWGELVHDDTNLEGWDGRYKGELMPMDVYVYFAIIQLPDGFIQELKGDVTLLR